MASQATRTKTKIIPAGEATQHFSKLLEEVRYGGSRVVVEQAGKPMAILIGIEEWENILETLAELNDPEYLASIQEARQEIEQGQMLSLDKLRAELSKAEHGR